MWDWVTGYHGDSNLSNLKGTTQLPLRALSSLYLQENVVESQSLSAFKLNIAIDIKFLTADIVFSTSGVEPTQTQVKLITTSLP